MLIKRTVPSSLPSARRADEAIGRGSLMAKASARLLPPASPLERRRVISASSTSLSARRRCDGSVASQQPPQSHPSWLVRPAHVSSAASYLRCDARYI